jgi:hypothetical protein
MAILIFEICSQVKIGQKIGDFDSKYVCMESWFCFNLDRNMLGVGPGRACKMWARVELVLYTILRARAFEGLPCPGLWAWGLDCSLSPKTRPIQAQAFGL